MLKVGSAAVDAVAAVGAGGVRWGVGPLRRVCRLGPKRGDAQRGDARWRGDAGW